MLRMAASCAAAVDAMAYQLTLADRVWNRACTGGGKNPLPGDQALAAMLRVHGHIMNGRIKHAIECLSLDEIAAGVRGYEFFQLGDLASMILKAETATDEESEQYDAAYYRSGDDSVLAERFNAVYAAQCDQFAAIFSDE